MSDADQVTPEAAPARARHDPLLLVCCSLPSVGLICFYGFVLRARLALERWPEPYRPDPKALGFDEHHDMTWFLIMAAIASPLALLICLTLRFSGVTRGRRMLGPLLWYLLSYIAFHALSHDDPGRFFEWFVD
jgi:hypothetical protein